MSSICVKWQGMDSAMGRYHDHRYELSGTTAAIRSIKSYRCMRGREFEAVYRALDRIVTRLDDEKKEIQNLETGLSDVLKAYTECEKELSEPEKKNPFSFGWKEIWSYVSKGGIVGSVISAVGGIVTGGWSGQTVIGSLKNILSAIGGISGAIAKGADAKWAEALFGTGDGLAKLDTSSWSKTFASSWDKQLDDLVYGPDANAATKTKVATKWGGYLLSLISNGIENVNEFKGQEGMQGRMIAETAIETGADILLGVGATAPASALLVAFGATAAPAVAVGVVSVGITWAANGVCKWLSGGRDIAEVISDAICDNGERKLQRIDSGVRWGKSLLGFG